MSERKAKAARKAAKKGGTRRAPATTAASKSVIERDAAAEPAIKVPDVVGDQGRARIIAQLIGGMQEELFRLEVMQLSNQHDDDATIPGGAVTYGKRRQVLESAIERTAETYKEHMPEVEEILAAARGTEP